MVTITSAGTGASEAAGSGAAATSRGLRLSSSTGKGVRGRLLGLLKWLIFGLVILLVVGFLRKDKVVDANFARIYPKQFNPNPSQTHDTWGLVKYSYQPTQDKKLPVFARRLAHPTIITRDTTFTKGVRLVMSIDGSNEGAPAKWVGNHTTEGKGIKIPAGSRVIIRYVGGRLSDLFGVPAAHFDCGLYDHGFAKASRAGEDYPAKTGDGKYREALVFRLRSADGQATQWIKFCTDPVADHWTMVLDNTFGTAGYLDIHYNDKCPWVTPHGTVECIDSYAGWNGDRMEFEVRIITPPSA